MFWKIKYVLKKNINMKTSYVVGLTVLSLFLVVGGISVALYTSQEESRGSLNIMTGNFVSLLEGNELENNRVIIGSKESKKFNIELKNTNSIDAKFNLYYTSVDGVDVRSYGGTMPPGKEGVVIKKGESKIYKIEIHNTTEEEKQIEFGSDVGLSTKPLTFPSNKKIIDIGVDPNDEDDSLYHIMKVQTKGTDENIDFSSPTINSGVYTKHETTLDTYPVYYYRGLKGEISNHIFFAGYCWLMVRTTDTGGVKIIYNGTATDGKCLGTQPLLDTGKPEQFNEQDNSLAYASYMYGDVYEYQSKENTSAIYGNDVSFDGSKYTLQDTYEGGDYTQIAQGHHYTCFSNDISCEQVSYVTYINSTTTFYITLENGKKIEEAIEDMFRPQHDSTVKTYLDAWYKENIDDLGYGTWLEDTGFCNDKTFYKKTNSARTKDGDSRMSLAFSIHERIQDSPYNQATLNCFTKRDNYTVDDVENGNGALTYPIGLLTADEASLAGNGVVSFNENGYLNINGAWWLMTPHHSVQDYVHVLNVDKNGWNSWNFSVTGWNWYRPVISLKAGVQISEGDGSSDRPYHIV